MNARFNFIIPDKLLERVRQVAEEKDVSSAKIINDLIRDGLGAEGIEIESKIEEFERRLKKVEKEVAILKNKK